MKHTRFSSSVQNKETVLTTKSHFINFKYICLKFDHQHLHKLHKLYS